VRSLLIAFERIETGKIKELWIKTIPLSSSKLNGMGCIFRYVVSGYAQKKTGIDVQ
jgi:hypothetical protein